MVSLTAGDRTFAFLLSVLHYVPVYYRKCQKWVGAFADGARTPPEELVNPASAPASFDAAYEELSQPA
jgi:hypothetical protein